MATSRKLATPLTPKRWIVTITLVDTPAPGESWLEASEIIDAILSTDIRAGVEIIMKRAEEITAVLSDL